MKPRRLIASLAKFIVLVIALSGIFYYWHVRPPQDVIDDAADDLLEITGNTYVSVHAVPIRERTLHRFVTAYGQVEPAPADEKQPAASATIASPIAARVANVECVEGQRIKRGQTLFTLDHSVADAEIAADHATLAAATSRRTKLSADTSTPQWVIIQADRDVDQATAMLSRDESQAALLTITSPIDGVVTRLTITSGSVANPNTRAVEVVSLDRLVLALSVPADVLKQIKIGADALGEFPGTSTVTRIDSAVDPQSGLGSVDIAVPADAGLRPGQSTHAKIVVETKPKCLVVPTSSVVADAAGRSTIAIIDDSGRWAIRTVVTTGIHEGDDIEITGSGLYAGQTVVATGAYGLTERTRVNLLKD